MSHAGGRAGNGRQQLPELVGVRITVFTAEDIACLSNGFRRGSRSSSRLNSHYSQGWPTFIMSGINLMQVKAG
jgi:hypothetical protein